MGHGAGGRNAVAPGGEDIAGGGETGDVGCARHAQGRLGAVGAPGGEIGDGTAGGGLYAAGRFGRQQRLVLHLVDDDGLRQLRRNQRSGNLQNGFVGEKQATLRQCPHAAGKAEAAQPGQEIGAEGAGVPQVGDGVIVKRQGGQAVQSVVHAGGYQVAPVGGVFPHIEAESRFAGHSLGEVGLGHSQLVKVGEQAGGAGQRRPAGLFVVVGHSHIGHGGVSIGGRGRDAAVPHYTTGRGITSARRETPSAGTLLFQTSLAFRKISRWAERFGIGQIVANRCYCNPADLRNRNAKDGIHQRQCAGKRALTPALTCASATGERDSRAA